jgi:hypothetical protein
MCHSSSPRKRPWRSANNLAATLNRAARIARKNSEENLPEMSILG